MSAFIIFITYFGSAWPCSQAVGHPDPDLDWFNRADETDVDENVSCVLDSFRELSS